MCMSVHVLIVKCLQCNTFTHEILLNTVMSCSFSLTELLHFRDMLVVDFS